MAKAAPATIKREAEDLREKLQYPQDALRVGLIHYNTAEEIDGFLSELSRLSK